MAAEENQPSIISNFSYITFSHDNSNNKTRAGIYVGVSEAFFAGARAADKC
jgi:hypothetical protein